MSSDQGLTPFGNALAGAFGAVFANATTFPLDTVKTRIQAEEKQAQVEAKEALPSPQIKRQNAPARLPPRKPSARAVARRIMREKGLEGFYRGFAASMLNTFSMQFAYFYWYTVVRKAYVERLYAALPGTSRAQAPRLGTATELSLGAVAGAIAQIFTIPVSVVATRQQLDDRLTGQKNLMETAKEIVQDDGVTGLWRGLKPSLILTINPAITYGMFERLKTAILGEEGHMTPGRAFYIGAMSKTLATVVTFPLILAKVRLQAKYDSEEEPQSGSVPANAVAKQKKKERYTSTLDVLRQLYKEKGVAGWYQGMQAQIIKAVLTQALLFGIKDMLEQWTVLFLLAVSRMRGKSLGVSAK